MAIQLELQYININLKWKVPTECIEAGRNQYQNTVAE